MGSESLTQEKPAPVSVAAVIVSGPQPASLKVMEVSPTPLHVDNEPKSSELVEYERSGGTGIEVALISMVVSNVTVESSEIRCKCTELVKVPAWVSGWNRT